MGEFDLIERYFAKPAGSSALVRLGIGDDCALLAPRAGHELAISTDMLVAGRHFFPDVDPSALGWKALAVNLSDLAAMGATPHAFTLALALPEVVPAWLEAFSQGLFACASQFGCTLIGGDTTRGPLNICITIFGEVPAGTAVRRAGARAGDDIWVSGSPGVAALGLRVRSGELQAAGLDVASLFGALDRPQPRVATGVALRGLASAMIDVSDGLLADLGHVLVASGGLGAVVDVDALPMHASLRAQPAALALQCILAGGDDYELCCCAPPTVRDRLSAAVAASGVTLTRIGITTAQGGITLIDRHGAPLQGIDAVRFKGYDHFD